MKRTERIKFWLDDDELALVDKKAKAAGLNRSAYIRKLMSETEVIPATDVDYALYASEFRRLGRNLNERLKRMNTTGEIDCDEIWFFHEGCGMKITILSPDGEVSHVYLGNDVGKGQRAMAIVPKGSIFSAANLDDGGYTFVSCVTVPKFSYDGFRLVPADEIRQRMGMRTDEIVISI